MKNLLIAFIMLMLYGCSKEIPPISTSPIESIPGYIKYTILKGQHYCDKSTIKSFSKSQLNFKVKFDSSAIYESVITENQYDINKLHGFSEGINHHQNSARIGWSWNKKALRLYAYVYSDSTRIMKEITTVPIGPEISCSIGISGSRYVFSINEATLGIERKIKGAPIAGYWLYPYFGGDEVAPHDVSIYILESE
ncbi:MAG: hypothetical protein ABIN01_17830 [Ferruginibacter sp.]